MAEIALGRVGRVERPARHFDLTLLVSALALSVVGVFMQYASDRATLIQLGEDPAATAKKQLAWMILSALVMVLVIAFDYRYYKVYAGFIYVGMILLLILVRSPLGTSVKGAQRSFQFAGFAFSPSEAMKIGLALMLAAFLSERKGVLSFGELLRACVIAGVPMVLVFLQPDVGTTIVLAAILVGTLIVAGAKAWHLAVLALVATALIAAAFQLGFVKQYQLNRLVGFLDPKTGSSAQYNQQQSKIAIGAGGVQGRGYLNGLQTNLAFVPEQHTDFINTAVGEEFGFVGEMALLFLFGVLLWRASRIALLSKDAFGTYVAAGIASMFAIQMFVNIGMTLGIMPITGIPLPFVSYGGSSLLANWAAIGLLENIHMRRFRP
jgi:rod shape determining protein RodA